MRGISRRRTRAGLAMALVTAAAISVAGCTSSASTDAAVPATTPSATATENPYGDGTAVDPPAPGTPVLTVTTADGESTALSMRQLRRLGTRDITVYEPFVQQQQTFTGVPLDAVLERAGVPPTVTVETIALNDYRFTAEAGEFAASQAMIAVARDGADIPMDQGGPIRLVFPDGTALAGNLDAWNWSLAEIRAT